MRTAPAISVCIALSDPIGMHIYNRIISAIICRSLKKANDLPFVGIRRRRIMPKEMIGNIRYLQRIDKINIAGNTAYMF